MEVWKREFDELTDMMLEVEHDLEEVMLLAASGRETDNRRLNDAIRMRERWEEIEQRRREILRKMFPSAEV